MSAETPTNPYSAFEKMTDEEVVLKAKEDNVLARGGTRGYYPGRHDRPL